MDHAERFDCFQLPIYANSYLHVSLKLPSVTLNSHNSLLCINSYKYPHKLSLIFHHLMFISFHTMLFYIVFLFALFTDIPVLSSHLESRDTFLFYLPSPRDTPNCFVFPVFLVYPIVLFYFFQFAIAYIKGHIKMQYYFFFVFEMSLAARTSLFYVVLKKYTSTNGG